MTREELAEALALVRTLIPPPTVVTTINGVVLEPRLPVAWGERTFLTEIRGEDGGFRRTRRRTTVRVYELREGETPHLYEMGIPVDSIDCPWHVEVMQKIPLSVDRSSVNSNFLLDVEQVAAELMAEFMTADQARDGWVSTALDTIEDDDAARAIITKRFGKAVIFDPNNPQSNKLALDAGYKVIHGSELSRAAWETLRRVEVYEPAGRVFDTGKVATGPDGVPPIPEEEWNLLMSSAADYARKFARYATGQDISVAFYNDARLPFAGVCGGGGIGFNLARMRYGLQRKEWAAVEFDSLLIHEVAHIRGGGDHLTKEFYAECCRVGAMLVAFHGTSGL